VDENAEGSAIAIAAATAATTSTTAAADVVGGGDGSSSPGEAVADHEATTGDRFGTAAVQLGVIAAEEWNEFEHIAFDVDDAEASDAFAEGRR
jgi:hypothetical protein